MKILLGITGGIAAYKTPSIASALTTLGNEVKCVCTEAAMMFVTEMALSTMSKNPITKSFNSEVLGEVTHIELANWCDLFVVVPCTANFIGKMAHGIADDILSTIFLALPKDKKIKIFPAMNSNMWESIYVQKNLQILAENKNITVILPEIGKLACGDTGRGKLASTRKVVEVILETGSEKK